MNYGRDTSNVFYDVTNYYFHTEEETNLIAKGYSKDYETLLPVLSKLKQNYRLKRAIVIADKWLNSGENKAHNLIKGDGYIFSRSLRGSKAKQRGEGICTGCKRLPIGEDSKIKSRIYPTDIWVEDKDGKHKKVTLDEKHIVFFSEEYAERTRHKRGNSLRKRRIQFLSSTLINQGRREV